MRSPAFRRSHVSMAAKLCIGTASIEVAVYPIIALSPYALRLGVARK